MLEPYRTKISAVRWIVFFGLLYFASQAAIGAILKDLDPALFLKAQTTFSRETFLDLIHKWQQAGLMDKYRQHFYLDFFHPLWYGLFLSALLARGFNLNGVAARQNWLLLSPFLASVMDLTENCFHVKFIANPEAVTQWMITISALATNIKWAIAGLSVMTAAVLFGSGFVKTGKL
jgi:hypothetical protein